MNIITGDIHEVIKTIETNSIDCIYNDPPFATTENYPKLESLKQASIENWYNFWTKD